MSGKPVKGKLKVMGVGFGRTGTKSLQEALEELGFAPCHHMDTVVANGDEEVKRWEQVANGKTSEVPLILADSLSSCDFPSCVYYKDVLKAYPDCKFVLTVRDPEKWYQSAYDTIYKIIHQPFPVPFAMNFVPSQKRLRNVVRKIVWQNIFHDRFLDKEYAIKVYNEYVERVKREIPADRLLIFGVAEGWAPLCKFLNVPIPNKPFPHSNDTAQFSKWIRNTRIAAWSVVTIPPLLLSGVAWYLHKLEYF